MTRRPPIPTPTYTLCPSPPLFRAARELPARAPRLSRLRTPLVVDHMGHLPADAGVAHPGFQHLLGLVRDGAWVKLSGAYRLSTAGFPYHDTIPLARALIEAASDRCIWGSDRSEGRRGGKAGVRQCRSRWASYHEKTRKSDQTH